MKLGLAAASGLVGLPRREGAITNFCFSDILPLYALLLLVTLVLLVLLPQVPLLLEQLRGVMITVP